MDKKIHLADTSERIRKKYRVKEISVKQQKYKKNQDDHSYSAAPQKSSAEKAKHSENYSTYHNAHKKNTVKNDEARSHYSEEDNSAEKEKYRKQMQYTACQQKASEISEKLSSDIQENIQMSKRQASISSYESEAPSKKQYDDKTKEAAAMLASRIAGDVLRKTHITENNDSQTKSGTASKSQRVTFYLNSNQIEKARLTKPNSEARKRFNKAAENTYKERKKLDVAIDKENCKLKKYHKEEKKLEKQASKHYTSAFEKAENILYLEGKISSAANKGSTGESAAALSSAAAEIALKKVVETVAQKHKSIGEMSRAAGAVAELSSSIDNENSIGSATASSVTAVPKYYIAQKAADTVKKTSEKHYKDKLEKKREALRQKQKAAEHRIEELKKEQAKRQQKINIYKSENGITSKNNTTLQNVKAVIKSQQNAAKAAAVAKSSATVIAAAGGVIIPIICVIVVVIIIIVLFSWMTPHEDSFYVEADNIWEVVTVNTTEEVLKGYVKHLQGYFDERQLDILEVVDINYDGFKPDKYDYKSQYIWSLYEYGNKWIKLSDDCDYEHIIALAAVKKWQEIEAVGFDSSTYTFEITNADLDFCAEQLYNFSYGYRKGMCAGNDCHKYYTYSPRTAHYTCNRSQTHKHLIGQVTNFEKIGGYDLVLNKILNVPVESHYATKKEYEAAVRKFETDKALYEVYVQYICDTLGTSTKIPDYENDLNAQSRLKRMHISKRGKKPRNPPQNLHANCQKMMIGETAYYGINAYWDPPEPEEDADGNFVEIKGYKVRIFDKNGTILEIADISSTSISQIPYKVIPNIPPKEKDYIYMTVVAYNDLGVGPPSSRLYIELKE